MAKISQAEALSHYLREGINAHQLNNTKVRQKISEATLSEVAALNERGENALHILAVNPRYCKDEWFTNRGQKASRL